ncbi:MAG: pseudouridine synthase [Deltaproteobacteria bacterium]|nr:pseudouridine synthase [Deltaproteobacteria bacterium]
MEYPKATEITAVHGLLGPAGPCPINPCREKDCPEAPAEFTHCLRSRVFSFTYEGEPAPLKEYLTERYRYGRPGSWALSFYPERVRLNGREVSPDTMVQPGDRISYRHLRNEEPPPPPLQTPLYTDQWLLALEKPDSVPVNPSGVYYYTSLSVWARELLEEPELTPLHRLDLETAGVLLLVRRSSYINAFQRLFRVRRVRKRYRALVHGHFPLDLKTMAGRIVPAEDSPIHTLLRLVPAREPAPDSEEGAQAGRAQASLTNILGVTHHTLAGEKYSEVELEPVTGQTNQLRVQLAHLGHHIVGDKKYHPDPEVFLDWVRHRDFGRLRGQLVLPRQALHCLEMSLEHPFTGESLRIASRPGAWEERIAPLMTRHGTGGPAAPCTESTAD